MKKDTNQIPVPKDGLLFKHRYKWSNEEIITIVILGILTVAALIVTIINNGSLGYSIITGAFLCFGLGAYYVGNKRKTESTMRVIYDTVSTEMIIDGHLYDGHRNRIKLADVKTVGVKQLGYKVEEGVYVAKDVLIFHPEESGIGRQAQLPLRSLSNPDLYKIVNMVLESKGSEGAKAAAAFGASFTK